MSRILHVFAAKSLSDTYAPEQIVICRQLFADHVLGPQPMEKEEKNVSNDKNSYLQFQPVSFPYLLEHKPYHGSLVIAVQCLGNWPLLVLVDKKKKTNNGNNNKINTCTTVIRRVRQEGSLGRKF